MRKLMLLAVIAGLGLASCEKEGGELVDRIANQGTDTVQVDAYSLAPTQEIILPHKDTYMITCPGDCKVNINGGLHYETGVAVVWEALKTYK